MTAVADLEKSLNSFDAEIRAAALAELVQMFENGVLKSAPETIAHNLHCHTFFSYNANGWSPSYIAYIARKNGFYAAGTVDFDVLDGVDEFLNAARVLGVRACCGIESRTFIAELADKEINSPGEPGISYHMGVGFTSSKVPAAAQGFLDSMRSSANARTAQIAAKVSEFLAPVSVDFEADVQSLTPKGNATERHLCTAFRLKSEKIFPDCAERINFWNEKLASDTAPIISDIAKLEALIRAKTMKSGGVGYVKADPDSFPAIEKMNEFILQCGAIPVITWLNGESAGENNIDYLLDLEMSKGAAMLNIIPDRNWNFPDPEVREKKAFELNRVIEAAKKRDLPIIVGTELNAPGLKTVDDFASDALAPHAETFAQGALIACNHTCLAPEGKGYLSDWAKEQFGTDTAAKNRFFLKA